MRSLSSNLFYLYLIKIAHWFLLIMPIIVLFYEDNGLDTKSIFLLQAVYSITIVILEIPSGYLADAYGRKNSIIIGAIFGFLGYLTYCFSFSFWGFLFAELILGIGQSFISGSDSAILYDTLLETKKEDDYTKYEGRITSVGNFAEAIAGISGGLLATMSLRFPVYFQAVVAFIGIPASLLLFEPVVHKKRQVSFADIISIARYALITNKYLRYIILYSAVIGTSTLTMAWFAQIYFKFVKLPLAWYGFVWTLLNFSVGVFSMMAFRIEKRVSQTVILSIITISIPWLFFLCSLFNSLWAISFLFIFYFVRGLATPTLKNYINKGTASDVRATVLSIRNFVIRLQFALMGPFIGWMTDKISLTGALKISAVIFLIFSVITMFLFIKKGNNK